MKSIKILGTGCPKCISTEKIVEEVVNELNIDAKIEKVTDIMEIMAFEVMTTPAVVVDNTVMIKGKVPSKDEVKAILADNFANNACCSGEEAESSSSPCCSSDDNGTSCC